MHLTAPVSSPQGLGFQHMNYEGTQTFSSLPISDFVSYGQLPFHMRSDNFALSSAIYMSACFP